MKIDNRISDLVAVTKKHLSVVWFWQKKNLFSSSEFFNQKRLKHLDWGFLYTIFSKKEAKKNLNIVKICIIDSQVLIKHWNSWHLSIVQS